MALAQGDMTSPGLEPKPLDPKCDVVVHGPGSRKGKKIIIAAQRAKRASSNTNSRIHHCLHFTRVHCATFTIVHCATNNMRMSYRRAVVLFRVDSSDNLSKL